MWRNPDGFAYEKRPYFAIFENSLHPVLCWPNAGEYIPLDKNDFEIALLGKLQAVWTGKEGSEYLDR